MARAGQLERCVRRLRDEGDPRSLIELQWPGTRLDTFQLDIIRHFFQPDTTEILIKGCAKAGKGCAVAIGANLWFWLADECKVIVTSDTFKHAVDVMFAEVASWRRRMRYPGVGTTLRTSFWAHEKKYLTVANPSTGEGFSGHHGPRTLFVFDEATSAPDEFYDLASTQAKLVVALANPRTLSGWFRRAFPHVNPNRTQTVPARRGQRRCVTISGRDCRNVIEGREVIPNQITRELFEAHMAHHDERWGRVFGLGEFPDEDGELQVVRPSWLAFHQEAWNQEKPPVQCFGLDLAASDHGDKTVLAAGGAGGVHKLHTVQKANTMDTCAWVLRTARDSYGLDLPLMRVWVCVDMDGIGKGVGDRLKELGVKVIEFHGGSSAEDHQHYKNRRAEAYGELGRRLNPEGPWGDEPFALPLDDELARDLTAPEKIYGSDGMRFGITPKRRQHGMVYRGDTLTEKLGRSPDKGDAVAMMYEAVRFAVRRAPPKLRRPILTARDAGQPASPPPPRQPPRLPARQQPPRASDRLDLAGLEDW
jgi:hypothetical protein